MEQRTCNIIMCCKGHCKLDNAGERSFEARFFEKGYNTRVFNPDGQDDIGGGCGQLWYVQKWMKERGKK